MALGDDLKNSEETLKNMNKEAVEFESTVSAINEQLKNIAKEEKDIADIINVATKNNSALAAASKKVSELKKQDLTSLKKQRELEKAQAKFAGLQAKSSAIQAVIQDRISNSSGTLLENLFDIQELIRDVGISSEQTANNFKEIQDSTEKVNRAAKGFDKIANTLGSIPGIGPFISDAFKNAAQSARDAAAASKGFGASMLAGLGSLFSIKGLLAASVGFLFAADKRTTELAKSLQISKEETREINKEFNAIAVNSGKAFLNQKNLQEATAELSQQLGVSNRLNNDLVKNQTFLTKQLGLSADSAAELARYSVFTGKSAEETNEEIADQVVNLQKETGIALKLNDVFDEVNKANAGLKAAYGFNNKLIAEQVVLTKQLGLSLDQTTKIASQLLDFESSISKELEAELLTGKELNLEKARLLALQGKNTEAAAELAKQVGGTAELSRMNVLQQEALAEAMGMERNELIQSVQQREILSRLGEKSIADAAKTEEGRRRIVELGGEQLLQQYEQESAAEKFQAAVVKIQEALGTMLEGPLGGILDSFASLLSNATALKVIIGGIIGLSFAKLITSIISMGAALATSSVGAISLSSALTLGIGAAAIAAGIGVAFAAMNSASAQAESNARSVNDAFMQGATLTPMQTGTMVQANKDDEIYIGKPNRNVGNVDSETNQKMLAALEKNNQIQERILAKDTSVNITSAIDGVSYYNDQLQKINQYNTSVAG